MSFTKKQIAFIKVAIEGHGEGAELNRYQLNNIAEDNNLGKPGWIKTAEYRVAKGL